VHWLHWLHWLRAELGAASGCELWAWSREGGAWKGGVRAGGGDTCHCTCGVGGGVGAVDCGPCEPFLMPLWRAGGGLRRGERRGGHSEAVVVVVVHSEEYLCNGGQRAVATAVACMRTAGLRVTPGGLPDSAFMLLCMDPCCVAVVGWPQSYLHTYNVRAQHASCACTGCWLCATPSAIAIAQKGRTTEKTEEGARRTALHTALHVPHCALRTAGTASFRASSAESRQSQRAVTEPL
jgi:hypothetical protein